VKGAKLDELLYKEFSIQWLWCFLQL